MGNDCGYAINNTLAIGLNICYNGYYSKYGQYYSWKYICADETGNRINFIEYDGKDCIKSIESSEIKDKDEFGFSHVTCGNEIGSNDCIDILRDYKSSDCNMNINSKVTFEEYGILTDYCVTGNDEALSYMYNCQSNTFYSWNNPGCVGTPDSRVWDGDVCKCDSGSCYMTVVNKVAYDSECKVSQKIPKNSIIDGSINNGANESGYGTSGIYLSWTKIVLIIITVVVGYVVYEFWCQKRPRYTS